MKIYILIALGAAMLGCACIYLASPQQQWLTAPWSAQPARGVGLALVVLAWIGLAKNMLPITATFVLIVALMLIFVALPYLGALLNIMRGR